MVIPDSVLELEQELADVLAQADPSRRSPQVVLPIATRWSQAVWNVAQIEGRVTVDRALLESAFFVASRPVFVCGVHRSGTTLVRDLLDGHPALSVLPAEGSFFTNMEGLLKRTPSEEHMRLLGCEWLRRLANPIHQAPFWLLGRSSHHDSRYVSFAREVLTWWPLIEAQFASQMTYWPQLSIGLAYAQTTGNLSLVQRWVEKTPTNEFFLQRLVTEFPAAKIIHVIRHPAGVYASRKRVEHIPGMRFRVAARALKEMDSSYRIAAQWSERGPVDRYRLLRYEELIDDPDGTMRRLAKFIGIEALDCLVRPAVAGLPSASNSSFVIDAPRGRIHGDSATDGHAVLTRGEQLRLASIVRESARLVGYSLPFVSPWRSSFLRLAIRLHR